MDEHNGQMIVRDYKTAREWFSLIENGVPQDKANELLETEATSANAPEHYRTAFAAARNQNPSNKDGLLTEAEIIVLLMYTGTVSLFNAKFNEDCRNRKWERYKTLTSLLHSAICKLRRKHRENVKKFYRGISCDSFDTSVESAFLPSFTSTTTLRDVAEVYCGKLLTVESTTFGSIQDFSIIPDEAETLVSPFQCFTNKKNSSQFVLLSEMEPSSPFLAFPLIRGSLLGAVVGNSIGSSYEFAESLTVEQLMKNIEELEMQNDVLRNKCCYSADTCMTLALAESLTRVQKLQVSDLKKSLAEAYTRNPYRNYGSSSAQILSELHKQKECDDHFAPARKAFNGQGSYGNGGAMRIAPAALYFWVEREKQFNEIVRQITALTHSNPIAINGAILQATAVQQALRSSIYGERTTDFNKIFIETLLEKMQLVEPPTGHRPYCFKLEKIKKYLTSTPSNDTVRRELGNDLNAYTSVPTAIYCFLRGMSPIPGIPADRTEFERTIIYAISVGGDTDTIASMAGAIAGAYYGQDAVTQRWRDLCETKAIDDAKRYADEIANQRFWDDS